MEGDRLVIERRAFGGNTVAAKVISSPYQVISVMPKLFDPEPGDGSEGQVVSVDLELELPKTKVVEQQPKEAGTVNLEEAEVLVCVGRGVAAEEDLEMIQSLAEVLGGMVGCTRPISHDYHWLTEDQMVGLSGKEISPALYVAIGVSGQIQHTVGILNAKTILAINKDSNAPIFKIADYGIVGDLYDVVPKLIDRIQGRQ
jgi:electron transfer flavoprotein alpha subunit